jgi:hypothetical protein
MPNNAPSHPDLITPFAAFPCVLIDRVMPKLKDTEWRLLCVVVRQTVGWGANGHRHKRRDWMTQRQLIERTGRNSAAISSALNTLVRRRLVDASDEEGKLLLTPQERRRHSGRLYLGLCYAGIETLTAPTANAKSEQSASKSAVANANTTIEEDYNKLPVGKETSSFSKTDLSLQSRRFLRQYQALFRERTVSREAPPIIWGRDMKIARDLLKVYPYERLTTLLTQFFASDDAWFEKSGYSLPCFRDSISKLLLREGQTVLSARSVSREVQPRTYTGWQRASDINNGSALRKQAAD